MLFMCCLSIKVYVLYVYVETKQYSGTYNITKGVMLRSKRKPAGSDDGAIPDVPVLLGVTRFAGSQPVFTTQTSGTQVYPMPVESDVYGPRLMDNNDSSTQEEFEDPDTPLTVSEKVKVTSLLVFLYGMFVVAAVLCAVYN